MYRVLVFRCHSCMCSFAKSKSNWSWTEFDWTIVWLSDVWLFSIGKMLGWVRSCSIAESNLQSKSIEGWELSDHQTFDDSTGCNCLLRNIIHTVHIPSLSPDGIINMDIFNLDYEQSLIFLSPSNKTRVNTHARDWRRETGTARKKRVSFLLYIELYLFSNWPKACSEFFEISASDVI